MGGDGTPHPAVGADPVLTVCLSVSPGAWGWHGAWHVQPSTSAAPLLGQCGWHVLSPVATSLPGLGLAGPWWLSQGPWLAG